MAVYHAPSRLLFLATPHAGSRSLAASLEALGGRASLEHHDTLEEVLAQGLLHREDLPEITVFTSIRNHFDALPTWWRARGKGRSFPHFLMILATMPGMLADGRRLYWQFFDDADVALRFEDLVEGRLGLRPTLPHLGQSPPRDYQGFYDDEGRRMVEDVFREELRDLGYGFEPAPPLGPLTRRPQFRG